MTELAPAKINLCLFLGPTRASDGRHELVSVMAPLAFGDDVTIEPADADEVVCPGVEGPNLAAEALRALRAEVGGAPVRLTIVKRTPVAAGMGGGSADAAAALRLAAEAAGVSDDRLLLRIAERLGADVPAQVRPAPVLATGAGERLEPLARAADFGILVLPSPHALSTGDVFREADRLGLPRDGAGLAGRLDAVRAGLGAEPFGLDGALIVNDLEPAALALCPAIDEALAVARREGADHALVCGSGPTVIGLFADPAAAVAAAARLARRVPAAVASIPYELAP